MTKAIRFLFIAILLFIVSIPAIAQEEINEGDSIEGEASDEIVEYEIELEKGAAIEINLEADWDTYLEIYDDNGNMLASDDDGGEGLQSRLIFVAPNSDNYFIRVRAFGGSTPEGDYELTVDAITVNQLVSAGELEYGNDEEVDADDTIAVEATFNGTEGDFINITVQSDNYQSLNTILYDPDGDEIANGYAGIQRIELEESGIYTIRIEEYYGGILDGDIEIEVNYAQSLSMDNGTIEFEIDNSETDYYINFTAEDDVIYQLTVLLDDEPDTYSDLSFQIFEEDQDETGYSDLTFSMRGGLGISYIFEADDDGEFVIRLTYYGSNDIDVTMSIEAIEE